VLASSVLFGLAAGLAVGADKCYVVKEPLGCAQCGTSSFAYCEEGCEEGGPPGKTGPGVLKTWYCYTYGEGTSAT